MIMMILKIATIITAAAAAAATTTTTITTRCGLWTDELPSLMKICTPEEPSPKGGWDAQGGWGVGRAWAQGGRSWLQVERLQGVEGESGLAEPARQDPREGWGHGRAAVVADVVVAGRWGGGEACIAVMVSLKLIVMIMCTTAVAATASATATETATRRIGRRRRKEKGEG
jgi:hypothetical protein